MKSLLTFLSISLLSTAALADDSPKHNCKVPIIPSTQASPVVRKYFDKHSLEYRDCIKKFVDEQHDIEKITSNSTAQALAHDSAEAATKEYNDFMAVLNERNENTHADEDN